MWSILLAIGRIVVRSPKICPPLLYPIILLYFLASPYYHIKFSHLCIHIMLTLLSAVSPAGTVELHLAFHKFSVFLEWMTHKIASFQEPFCLQGVMLWRTPQSDTSYTLWETFDFGGCQMGVFIVHIFTTSAFLVPTPSVFHGSAHSDLIFLWTQFYHCTVSLMPVTSC